MPEFIGPSIKASSPVALDLLGGDAQRGDLLMYDGTKWVPLHQGTQGYYLKAGDAGNLPSWDVPEAEVSNGSVTNAKLASMAGHTIKMRSDSGAGSPQDMDITSLPEESSPSGTDLVLARTSGGMRKVKMSNLPGGGGGGGGDSVLGYSPSSETIQYQTTDSLRIQGTATLPLGTLRFLRHPNNIPGSVWDLEPMGLQLFELVENVNILRRTVTSVNTTTDRIDLSGSLVVTGSLYNVTVPVTLRTTGTLPSPLLPNRIYYAKYATPYTYTLHDSYANAHVNTRVNITTSGSGTHTVEVAGPSYRWTYPHVVVPEDYDPSTNPKIWAARDVTGTEHMHQEVIPFRESLAEPSVTRGLPVYAFPMPCDLVVTRMVVYSHCEAGNSNPWGFVTLPGGTQIPWNASVPSGPSWTHWDIYANTRTVQTRLGEIVFGAQSGDVNGHPLRKLVSGAPLQVQVYDDGAGELYPNSDAFGLGIHFFYKPLNNFHHGVLS